MNTQIEMPKYKCHKEVLALKIKDVKQPEKKQNEESDGSLILSFEDEKYAPIRVSWQYRHKHNPQPGGYYVVYKGGYQSFSPAKAFEDGYTRI